MTSNLLKIENNSRIIYLLTFIFVFIVSLTVFQDFLASKRIGYSFHLEESLLFNILWILFIPLLFMLHLRLKFENLFKLATTFYYIIIAIVIHLLISPIIVWILSQIFLAGRYDILKIYSYTLTTDLYKVVIVYSTFVLGYKYFLKQGINKNKEIDKVRSNTIVISSKRNNIIVDVQQIIHITSEKPYILIHLENQQYLHANSLKSIIQELDSTQFVRIHKSGIVNVLKISSYKTRLNGDFDILLKTGQTLRLSRTYAKEFKTYFKNPQVGS